MRSSVEADRLGYVFRGRSALTDVSFALPKGVTGLLGPNGAGKSTLMSLIATVRRPQTGSLKVMGVDPASELGLVRRQLGYLPQRFDVLRSSTVLRNVEYAAWARGLSVAQAKEAAEESLEQVDLAAERTTLAGRLSGGMRQRLGIACAVVHRPAVILLDEPTVGLDPVQRVGVRHLIRNLAKDATVLVSTHLLEDLTGLTSAVLVLSEGRVKFQGSLSEMEALSAAAPEGLSAAEAGYAAVLGR